MVLLGLTGGIGCGKSTVLKIFRELGANILSADEVVAQIYQDSFHCHKILELLEIKKSENLELDKKHIAQKVFQDTASLKKLEGYIHPIVRQKFKDFKAESLNIKDLEIAVYEVPLLFEKELEKDFDFILTVGLEAEVQIERIKARNHWDEQEIKNRIQAQRPLSEKKEKSDFYIDNSADLNLLKQEVEKIYLTLIQENK